MLTSRPLLPLAQVPEDVTTGSRVTGNPLMLSMVLSIFESRGGGRQAAKVAASAKAPAGARKPAAGAAVSAFQKEGRTADMPRTITELYHVAATAMLDRLERKERGDGSAGNEAVPRLRQLLEALFFQTHAAERRVIRQTDLETAALGLANEAKLSALQAKDHAAPAEPTAADEGADEGARDRLARRTHEEFEALPEEARGVWAPAVHSLIERVRHDRLPLLSLISAHPTEMQSSHLSFQEFYAAQAICKGYRLPPGASAPWRWSAWFANTLVLGAEMGDRFARGLLTASRQSGDERLELRADVGGHRPTSFKAINLLCTVASSVDLRDNYIGDEEVQLFSAGLHHPRQLLLAGNRITARGAAEHLCHVLARPLAAAKGACTEGLDLSRNPLCAKGAEAAEAGILELAMAVAANATLRTLRLHQCSLTDAAGASFIAAFVQKQPRPPKAPAPDKAAAEPKKSRPKLQIKTPSVVAESLRLLAASTARKLTLLDLSSNGLGAASAAALASALAAEVLPALQTLELQENALGVEGGLALAGALSASASLRVLDLSSNSLCRCGRGSAWSKEAVAALLAALLEGAALEELLLEDNGLGGLWSEHLFGERLLRGAYTAVAVTVLVEGFTTYSVALRKLGVERNHLRPPDVERLLRALEENVSKDLPRKQLGGHDADVAAVCAGSEGGPLSPPPPPPPLESPTAAASTLSTPGKSPSEGGARRPFAATPLSAAKTPSPVGKPLSPAEMVVGKPPTPPSADRAKGKSSTSDQPAAGGTERRRQVSGELAPQAAPLRSRGTLTEGSASPPPGAIADKDSETPAPVPAAAVRKAGAFHRSAAKPAAEVEKVDGKTPRSARGSANKPSAGAASARAGRQTSGELPAKCSPRASDKGGGGAKYGAKRAVAEEAPAEPFQDKELVVASTANLAVRKEPNTTSTAAGGKLAMGTLMRVLKQETAAGKSGAQFVHVALEGETEPLGWVQSVGRDGTKFVQPAAAGLKLMRTAKQLICRESTAADSRKIGEVPAGELVRVVSVQAGDGENERACIGRDDPKHGGIETLGWVSKVTKEGRSALEPPPRLSLTFNLEQHRADALSRALHARSSAPKKRKEGKPLPRRVAVGKDKPAKAEDSPSRHEQFAKQPATLVLMFNCFKAGFEVTSGDVESLPGNQTFDLLSKKSQRRLGVVRLAKTLGMPFLERVEFPDEWLLADEHGVEHDGWQGDGNLQLELKAGGGGVYTMEVQPWLAYGCSEGTRILIRKRGTAEGQCATVQRILSDDRCVARLDGFTKEDGVKGEVIVDPQPRTLVRTPTPGYARGQKLLLLHHNQLIDAVVLDWLGALLFDQSSRHLINVGHGQARANLNAFNHVPAQLTACAFEQIRMRYYRHLLSTEDKVEDAITGNLLKIEDQLIFMVAATIADGCMPAQFMPVSDVPTLCAQLTQASPERTKGSHTAQPVLCRAGPGTGKTWMVKQSLYLTTTTLAKQAEAVAKEGKGVPLVPFVVFVQRIVRLLRELGDDPSALLQDPKGLMRWYIDNQFADKKEERTMLMMAFEMRACVVLVDGVDEAAGMRDIVEAFVHFELVTSGNRLVVTSRPEGVDLDDYKPRFVVMNLLELSQEQQRNVIQMQLQGNAFFEHLVNIAECRKDLDERYRETFRSEGLRIELEAFKFGMAEAAEWAGAKAKLIADANAAKEERRTAREADEKAVGTKAEEEEYAREERWTTLRSAALANLTAPSETLPVRKMTVEGQAELQVWLAKMDVKRRPRSRYLDLLNASILQASKHGCVLLSASECS